MMNINVDFPLLLTLLVLISGLIVLVDKLFLAGKRAQGKKASWLVTEARSFFPLLLIVLIIRSFIVQPYRVPTGSLEPTVLPGDLIVVSQFAYGIRLPVLHTKIFSIKEPKIGDIALFYWPKDPSMILVKRIIGTPGDHIIYKNKTLTINGKLAPQQFVKDTVDIEPGNQSRLVEEHQETLNGIKHNILVRINGGDQRSYDITVPPHAYFAMGDNRDNSDDSRFWGFVPEENLIGKAFRIIFSWDPKTWHIRWQRIGHKL